MFMLLLATGGVLTSVGNLCLSFRRYELAIAFYGASLVFYALSFHHMEWNRQ